MWCVVSRQFLGELGLRSFLIFGKAGSSRARERLVARLSPVASPGAFVGVGATVFSLALAALFALAGATAGGIGVRSIAFGLAALCFSGAAWSMGELTYAAFRLRYEVSETKFTIRCGWQHIEVPLHEIKGVLRGCAVKPPRRLHGIRWPGFNLARGYLRGMGEVHFFATCGFDEMVLVCLERRVYAVSPENAEQLISLLKDSCTSSSAAEGSAAATTRHPVLVTISSFFVDSTARAAFLGGLVLNVALFAILAFGYSRLPEAIPVHFNSLGQADIIGDSYEVFKLPAIGLFVWSANGLFSILLHRRERALCYLLLGAAGLVQIVLWGATAAILM